MQHRRWCDGANRCTQNNWTPPLTPHLHTVPQFMLCQISSLPSTQDEPTKGAGCGVRPLPTWGVAAEVLTASFKVPAVGAGKQFQPRCQHHKR